MLRAALVARCSGRLLCATALIEEESRSLTVREGEGAGVDEISALEAECFLLSGCAAEELSLPEAACMTADELALLGGQQREEQQEEPWRPEVAGRLPGELTEMAQILATWLGRLSSLSEGLRHGIAVIADEGGLPAPLVSLLPGTVVRGENPYFPEDMRADLPPRVRIRGETAATGETAVPQVAELFAQLRAGGLAGTDFEYRAEQEQFAQAVERTLSEEGHLLIEAGTGVGKSLGYLVPAVRWALASGQPVVVSTNTKILQDQLLTSDYPRLVRLLERELPAPVVLKGRENYLCLEKLRLHALTTRSELRELLQELEGLGQVRAGALALIALALHMVNVPAGDFDFIRLPDTLSAENSRRLKQKLSAAFRGCLRERCPLLKHCYFYAQREAAEHSPVTIVNHALLFALAHSENEATPDLLASFVDQAPVWVLDEAHNLEEVLLDALGVSINSYDLIEFVNGVSRLLQDRRLATRLTLPVDEVPAEHQEVFFSLRNLQAQVPGAAEAVFACFRNLSEVVSGAYARLREESAGELLRLDLTEPQKEEAASVRDALLDGVAALHDHLLDLNDGLLLLAEQTGGKPDGFFYLDDNRYQMRLREVLSIFAGLKQGCAGFLAEAETWVRWLEALPAGRRKDLMWELAACPVVVGEHFVNLVRSRKSVLMVSGTLAIHRSFEYVKRCLGLHLLPQESLREVVLASPFDYSRRALVLIPHDVPEPDFRDRKAHQRYLEALSEVVAEAAGVFGGAALVLFNSYADLQAVVKLSGELEQAGFTLLVQERGISRIQLAGRFRETEKAVLFGTRSFWEGFDIPGEDLQCVIISRLPFPNLNDPITAGKMRYIDRNGGNSFTEFMLPSAIMKFTQGFGRLIRSTQDYGCVLLLDRRVLTKNYGAEFLRNLPGPWIVRSPRNRLNNLMSQFLARVRSQA